jgi:hypothetical protein
VCGASHSLALVEVRSSFLLFASILLFAHIFFCLFVVEVRRLVTRKTAKTWRALLVSFLLCTVTFYANLAHSLTRSP